MTCRLQGTFREWEGETDAEGHRTYHVVFVVEADATDGPFNVMRCPGLPLPGSAYTTLKNDIDPWAYCLAERSAKPKLAKQGDLTNIWLVPVTFSTKPPARQRCQDNPIEDPLLEPPDISISYNRYSEEATHDRFGFPITNSAWEPLRGPQVEFDNNRGVIKIKQNVASYQQGVLLPSSMIDCVNDRPIWGIGTRCVKLSSAPADRKFYGHCSVYWARTCEFEVDLRTFDRDILDEGNKVLHGKWNTTTGEWELINIGGSPPDPFNPEHFDQFKDKNGENCRVVLNGAGLPAGVVIANPVTGIYYIRITAGSGTLPTNGDVWVQQTSGDQPFDDTEVYDRGDVVVTDIGDMYIATENTEVDIPPAGSWAILPSGINDKGNFDAATTYSIGDRVTYPVQSQVGGKEPAGSIPVQRYDERNFLLLGVPTILG